MKTFEAQTCQQWRDWLIEHHATESEVWLIFQKREATLSYSDALDEALCFGWIDSLVKRLDDDRYARKFTPRKPDSKWSTVNRNRYAQLKASGRLQPSGLNRPPTARSGDAPRPSTAELPADIEAAFQSQPAAWKFFQTLAPSYRRLYIAWIDSAKQQSTRTRRLQEALALLAAGKKLGLK
jgi:uncharacterized protein YdeI (YjbR/CyaY-like superfamily)